MDNFDLKKYLVENNVTINSRAVNEVDGKLFDYNWGKGVKIGGTNPSSLTFFFDKKLNTLVYTYNNTRGILSNTDLKQLHDFLSQYI
jgi:hypothetical protein